MKVDTTERDWFFRLWDALLMHAESMSYACVQTTKRGPEVTFMGMTFEQWRCILGVWIASGHKIEFEDIHAFMDDAARHWRNMGLATEFDAP